MAVQEVNPLAGAWFRVAVCNRNDGRACIISRGDKGMKIGAVMFFTADSMRPAALGRAMEERGFESLWVPEHTHIPSSRKSAYPAGGGLVRAYYEIMDPFLALNAAATATTTLKIGTGICLVIQRDPIVTAKMVSSIDQLSDGRFLFGVGNGWNQDEIENHGTEFKTRHKLARERIEAMKKIWMEEEPEYHGEFVNFDKMKQWPKPIQKPHPPIIVGGGFPHAARRAIRYGDGWIPRDDWLERDGMGIIAEFRKMAIDAGRDPASLPVSIFRVPDKIDRLRLCEDIGIDRVVFSLPAEKEEKILPILDRWAELKQQMGG
ncbi:LLM class F420-dependent oxidoreductase [Enhydrobacter aerosaccus]|nr:LLM class F420-dependent oxidoreductase [Enhydrobacter aerosaccus]